MTLPTEVTAATRLAMLLALSLIIASTSAYDGNICCMKAARSPELRILLQEEPWDVCSLNDTETYRPGTTFPSINITMGWCKAHCPGSQPSDLSQWLQPLTSWVVPYIGLLLLCPFGDIKDSVSGSQARLTSMKFRDIWNWFWGFVRRYTQEWINLLGDPASAIFGAFSEIWSDATMLREINSRLDAERPNWGERYLVNLLKWVVVLVGDTECPYEYDEQTANRKTIELDTLFSPESDKGVDNPPKVRALVEIAIKTLVEARTDFFKAVFLPTVLFLAVTASVFYDAYTKLGDNDTANGLAFGIWYSWLVVLSVAANCFASSVNAGLTKTTLGRYFQLSDRSVPLRERYFNGLLWHEWLACVQSNPEKTLSDLNDNEPLSLNLMADRIENSEGQPLVKYPSLTLAKSFQLLVGHGIAWLCVAIPSVGAIIVSYNTPTVGFDCRSFNFLVYGILALVAPALHIAYQWMLRNKGNKYATEGLKMFYWVFVCANAAVLTIGTILQLAGVYRSCRCQLLFASDTDIIEVNRNTHLAVDNAKAYWLPSELASLISDSKRRNNDVRVAAEQSLADLKTISVTSESQLAGDLCRRPLFVEPFILACRTKNTKLAATGTACIQRLTASNALARTRLPDLLAAFRDGAAAGYEPQLKILQTLPSLLQLYADDIHGDLLATVLELCASLQSSRTAAVSNTAAATFQQLVSAVFEKAVQGESLRPSGGDDGEDFSAADSRGASLDDAVWLFDDFCLLLDHQKPHYLKVESLPIGFLLETLQTILSTYDSLLTADRLRDQTWPETLAHGLSRVLARKDAFGMTARALSILLLMFQSRAVDLRDQLAEMTPLLMAALEKDGNPPWKRALFLEFFRTLCSDFSVFREAFRLFDKGEDPVKLIGQLMSALVRIAAEDPSLIGLGRQSTVPVQRVTDPKSEEAASIEAQGLGGAITSVTSNDANTTGISVDWSVVAVRLMDQPEKNTPPAIPSTYIYTLVLGCISHLCDGLSKFIMPLSVPSRVSQRDSSELGRRDSSATDRTDDDATRRPIRPTSASQKYQRLINPLTLTNHRLYAQIRTSADLIESCWPAALATCSTFLNAALDSEFYHMLIRSVQKLAQVSGVLELSTPRDALLTTLAKASIPSNASSFIAASQSLKSPRTTNAEHGFFNDVLKSPAEPPPTPTFQVSSSPLNVRHLLCLRALLNLGIALGPTLEEDAWFILIETMQTVEALIAMPNTVAATSQSESPRMGHDGQTTLSTEIAAVQAATKRMLDSTRSFSAEAFAVIVHALFRLLGQSDAEGDSQPAEQSLGSPISPTRLGAPRPAHHVSRSVSGLWTKSKTFDLEIGFVLNKLSDLSRINIYRFASSAEQACSWDLIASRLLRLSHDTSVADNHRIQSASILDLISMETVKLLDDPRFEASEADTIRSRCLRSLLQQLDFFDETPSRRYDGVELEIHKRLLDSLESMLSHSGESLNNCWPIALEILSISFAKRGQARPPPTDASTEQADNHAQTAQILRVAFRSIQLIASDFLGVLDTASLAKLAQLLRQFGSQYYDLNVALTSTTVLWSLASQALSRIETIDLSSMPTLESRIESVTATSESSSGIIWSVILLQLIELCKDERADVRNAAIKVLLKMLDASSEALSPNTWAIMLEGGLLDTVRFCITQYAADKSDQSEWMDSAAQLTEGIIQIISQNLTVVATHNGFGDTWLRTMDVLKSLLSTSSLVASSLAFSNLSKLLSALSILGEVDEDLIVPPMQLWTDYHPAKIGQDSEPHHVAGDGPSNQQAFTSHANVLVEAYKTRPVAVSNYMQGQTPMLMNAIECGILLCLHPPYTNDIKALAPEQKEGLQCMAILKSLLRGQVSEYSQFMLRMLSLTLNIQDGRIGPQHKKSAISKSAQKPTFIAFASTCLDNLRNLILEYAEDEQFIDNLAVQRACQVLSVIINTKYTKIPTNSQAPLWRNATVTAVVMLEALQKHVSHRRSRSVDRPRLDGLAPDITSIAVSILNSGGLPNPPGSGYTEETILEDETFDIEHFRLLHDAIVPIFQLSEEIREDACKGYAVVIFQASLLANPWFYDIPDDLTNDPLKDFLVTRPGSVHRPVFAVRRSICYAALDALFGLVSLQRPTERGKDQGNLRIESSKLASAAAPYLVLRVAHPSKTFLADQRLRGLTPPPEPQQVELQVVLSKFVELRSDGQAIARMTQDLEQKDPSQGLPIAMRRLGVGEVDDGKAHLRVLYALMLRVRKFWQGLPRLQGPGARAWQDDGPGKAIEAALDSWARVVAEDWGFLGIE
ncbi:hypothetical protein AYO20_06496 [Fonsecaea nubica]|uniref:Uncharacterized protein n=1 Tax=Fonsecaea nubica TaxID=856822 RepID=A0A178CZ50_9EURO|nr:hypothetical protein AYO20_06496 [Fonsecaea nubica]OAL34241.1 hypothetical protein AYO20_06496 [Fonsecaea nubica]